MQRNICVYCGSGTGGNPVYAEAAANLGQELVRRNLGLVYGGSALGMMGALANSVLAAGGHVTGVIPKTLARREVAHQGLQDLQVVTTMHERKALMVELSDGFIALPGGLGTTEELFEILTWAQLGIHRHPCGILNIRGYFDHLIAFIDHAVEQQFIRLIHRQLLLTDTSPAALLDKFDTYQPPGVPKWLATQET